MANAEPYIPKAEFDAIYGRVPRLTVEIIIRTPEGIVLTKRSMEPCKGQWHIPGGTVRFGEPLPDAVQRVAQDELGVVVKSGKLLGYIEYPDMMAAGYKGWPVGALLKPVLLAESYEAVNKGRKLGNSKKYPLTQLPSKPDF